MSEKIWHLKRCNLFEQLTSGDLRRLEIRSRARSFARKSPIYLPADAAESVFVVSTGRAKICHITPEGKQTILAFIEPGEMFGELSLLDENARRDEYAEAVEATTVVMVPRDILVDLMESHPNVSLAVTKMMGMRRQRIEQRLKNLLFLSNRERLTHLLLELAKQYGKQTDAGVELGIHLSHQELANLIGSTRETVTVVLGELASEKLILIGRRELTLLDLDKLSQSVQRQAPQIPSPHKRSPETSPNNSFVG